MLEEDDLDVLEEPGLEGVIGWLQWHGGSWVCGASCSLSMQGSGSHSTGARLREDINALLPPTLSSSLPTLVNTSPSTSLPPGVFVRSRYRQDWCHLSCLSGIFAGGNHCGRNSSGFTGIALGKSGADIRQQRFNPITDAIV